MKQIPMVFAAIAAFAFLILGFGSPYIIKEGHVGVITQWGKAVSQEPAEGLKFKMPVITGVKEFDVRERRSQDEMSAATANQLPIAAVITMSWRLDPSRVLEVYKNYGSPEQFEANILDPRIRQVAKAGLSKYQASDLIRDRARAAETILQGLQTALEPYPVNILSLQIENVELPSRYLEAVMAKEEAREAASKEEYNLQRQRLESQREVQSAEAARDAARARADGEAYRIEKEAEAEAKAITVRGEAQAKAIRAQQEAISGNPLIIEYERARRWDGRMPQTVMGEAAGLLMQIPNPSVPN